MTRGEVRALQRRLNRFTRKYTTFLTPLRVDGVRGPHTNGRVRTVKYYLGYLRPINAKITHEFNTRVNHPKNIRYPGRMKILSSPVRLARAAARRTEGRRRHRKNVQVAHATSGVGSFDGKPVANAAIPYLRWARANGWKGSLVSGWRDPHYSQRLCYNMCGSPSCPGRCAGTGSNHVGSSPSRFAVDVSDYYRFGQLMRRYPGRKIHNALGARDPVHFSPSGA